MFADVLTKQPPDPVVVIDREMRCVYANPAMACLAGLPNHSLVGMKPSDTALPLETCLAFEEAARSVFETGQEAHREHEVATADGPKSVQFRLTPLLAADGIMPYVLGVLYDVTDLNNAVRQAAESEERYRRLVDRCPVAVCVQIDGKLVFVNPAAVNCLGADCAEELIGLPVLGFVHPDDRAMVEERIKALNAGCAVPFVRERLIRKHGRVLVTEIASAPITYMGHAAVQVVFRDITDLMTAQSVLRDEAERMTAIIQTQSDIAAANLDDMDSLMDLIADRTRAVTSAPSAGIGIIEGEDVVYRWVSGCNAAVGLRVPLCESVAALCIQGDGTLLIDDCDTDPRMQTSALRRLGARSVAASVLYSGDQLTGVLTVFSQAPGAFTETHVRTLRTMAGFVAAAFSSSTRDAGRKKALADRTAALERLQESESWFRNLWEMSADGVRLMDDQGIVLMVNEAFCRWIGKTAGDMVGNSYLEIYHEEYRRATVGVLEERIREGTIDRHMEREVTLWDGRKVFLEVSNTIVQSNSQRPLILSSFRDSTECRCSDAALERYRILAEHTSEIMLFVRLDGTIMEANAAAARAYGYTREELSRMTVEDIRVPGTVDPVAGQFRSGELAPVVFESWHRRKDRSTFPIEASVECTQIGDERILLTVVRDSTERTAFASELAHQAFHDPLTQLPNRALFLDRLGHALSSANRREDKIAVLFLDVDRFKMVNDSLGHQAGDQLLVSVAGRLRSCIRDSDTAARFGGDEFTILLEGIKNEGEAIRSAERVMRRLQTPFEIDAHEVFVSGSIGIAVSSGRGDLPDDLLRSADAAMYQAKSSGKGKYMLYQRDMPTVGRERLQLETDLRRAVERNEFQIFYQPIVLMESQQTIGVEALARWQHPRFGLMPPGEFVPLQEQIGLIEPFTMWVLKEAQEQCLRWHRNGMRIGVSVNLSVHNLRDEKFGSKVGALLSETGMMPNSLKLEITESAVMMNPGRALTILNDLNDMGVRLSIDDFGTGYSSLTYLKQMPVHEIKIDTSFVLGMDASEDDDAAIVRATIDLAHNLRKKVVAEGVETESVWNLLSRLGCDAAQGYYMGRPMPAHELEDWLQTSPFGLPSSLAVR